MIILKSNDRSFCLQAWCFTENILSIAKLFYEYTFLKEV